MKRHHCGECDEFKLKDITEGQCLLGHFKTYSIQSDRPDCPKRIGETTHLELRVSILVRARKHKAEEEETIRGIKARIVNIDTPATVEEAIKRVMDSVGQEIKLGARELEPEVKFVDEPEEEIVDPRD